MTPCKLAGFAASSIKALATICVGAATAFGLNPAWAETFSGRVVGISDGDTITVLDGGLQQHKIRLAGIDAPEKRQPFGERSKVSLSELAYLRQVTISIQKKDRYGREVGTVLVNGQDLNLEQLRRGMAWHYKAYAREQTPVDRLHYDEAERSARHLKKGLWSIPDPTPPWDFRRMHRQ
jgi:endonuclease YncB( thermonuclease family)